MTIRIAAVAAAVLAVSALPLGAQGTAPQRQVVIPPSAIKSMTAQKPKSKRPLNSAVVMKHSPAPAVVAGRDTVAVVPTSVRAVKKIER